MQVPIQVAVLIIESLVTLSSKYKWLSSLCPTWTNIISSLRECHSSVVTQAILVLRATSSMTLRPLVIKESSMSGTVPSTCSSQLSRLTRTTFHSVTPLACAWVSPGSLSLRGINLISILMLGICHHARKPRTAVPSGSQIIQLMVLISTFGSRIQRREIPHAAMAFMSPQLTLAIDIK